MWPVGEEEVSRDRGDDGEEALDDEDPASMLKVFETSLE